MKFLLAAAKTKQKINIIEQYLYLYVFVKCIPKVYQENKIMFIVIIIIYINKHIKKTNLFNCSYNYKKKESRPIIYQIINAFLFFLYILLVVVKNEYLNKPYIFKKQK